MTSLEEEESIPNLSEFQLSSSTPFNEYKGHISEQQIVNEENFSREKLQEIHGKIPVYTAHCQSLKEFNSSLMSETFDSESEDNHDALDEISNSKSQNNFYDIQWRFNPNMWQMKNGTRCLDFQHMNLGYTSSGNVGEVTGSPELTVREVTGPPELTVGEVTGSVELTVGEVMGSPELTDSLEDADSQCSSENIVSSTQIAILSLNGREAETKESCQLYQEDQLGGSKYYANVSPKTIEDEVMVPERLSNTGNFDLKCSSSVDQVSFRRNPERNLEIQNLARLGNNKRVGSRTSSSCIAPRNPVPPIQQARVGQSEQTIVSDSVILPCHRVMESLVDHDDNTIERDVNTHLVNSSFAVENNNENHHRLIRIRNNCTKVSKFCNSKPMAIQMLETVKGTGGGNNDEERQVAVIKEIKSGEQHSDTVTGVPGNKHGRRKSKKRVKEDKDATIFNTLALRKTYDEKQRAETKKHIHRTPKKEEYEECVCGKMGKNRSRRRRFRENVELPKIVSNGEVFKHKGNKDANRSLKENLAIYNGPGRILVVKMESETCHQAFIDSRIHLDRLNRDDQNRSSPHQEESVDYLYEDDFECDDEKNDLTTLSSQEDERSQFQSTNALKQQTHNERAQGQVRNENSYLEISRRMKASLSSRNILFTRPSDVCSGGYAVTTSEMLYVTSDTTPSNSSGTDSEDSSGKEFVHFPSIQMNNFVSERLPRNAFSQGRVGMFRNRQVREKAVEIYRRRSEQLHKPPPRYTHHVKVLKLPPIRRRQTPNNIFREPPTNKNARRK